MATQGVPTTPTPTNLMPTNGSLVTRHLSPNPDIPALQNVADFLDAYRTTDAAVVKLATKFGAKSLAPRRRTARRASSILCVRPHEISPLLVAQSIAI
jgi:hypothetical protein